MIRRDALEATISELVADSPWAQTVARLGCLRGDRHALGGRAVRPGRRLRAVPAARAAFQLPRAGPLGEQLRRDPSPRRDHQVWLPARLPAAGRGRLALPPPTAPRRQATAPPRSPARRGDRDRLEGQNDCTAPGTMRDTDDFRARRDDRSRRRSGTERYGPAFASAASSCVALATAMLEIAVDEQPLAEVPALARTRPPSKRSEGRERKS